jgi:hypothetical protein
MEDNLYIAPKIESYILQIKSKTGGETLIACEDTLQKLLDFTAKLNKERYSFTITGSDIYLYEA